MSEWSFRNLNLKGVNPQKVNNRLPVGRHEVTITEAKMQAAKSGGGSILYVKMEDDEGLMAEDYITVFHKNEDAERIGRERLMGLLVAGHHPNPEDPEDVKSLIGLRLGVVIDEDEFQSNRGDGAIIKTTKPRRSGGAYFEVDGHHPPAGGSSSKSDIPF